MANRFDVSLLRNIKFMLLAVSFFLMTCSADVYSQLTVSKAVSEGLSELDAALLMSYGGIAGLVSTFYGTLAFHQPLKLY